MEKSEILRHDIFDFVGDVNLVAIELNLVAVNVEVVLDLREIEDTGEVERIVHVEMDVEKRLVHLERIEFVVELIVVLIGKVGRFARPSGVHIVDDVVLVGFDLLAILPVFLLAKGNLDRQELAVFAEQTFDGCVLEVLCELVVDMKNDVGSAVGLDGILHIIFRRAFARPMDRFRIILVAEREYLNLLCHHKGGIEAQTKMADDGFGFVLVLIDELLCA